MKRLKISISVRKKKALGHGIFLKGARTKAIPYDQDFVRKATQTADAELKRNRRVKSKV